MLRRHVLIKAASRALCPHFRLAVWSKSGGAWVDAAIEALDPHHDLLPRRPRRGPPSPLDAISELLAAVELDELATAVPSCDADADAAGPCDLLFTDAHPGPGLQGDAIIVDDGQAVHPSDVLILAPDRGAFGTMAGNVIEVEAFNAAGANVAAAVGHGDGVGGDEGGDDVLPQLVSLLLRHLARPPLPATVVAASAEAKEDVCSPLLPPAPVQLPVAAELRQLGLLNIRVRNTVRVDYIASVGATDASNGAALKGSCPASEQQGPAGSSDAPVLAGSSSLKDLKSMPPSEIASAAAHLAEAVDARLREHRRSQRSAERLRRCSVGGSNPSAAPAQQSQLTAEREAVAAAASPAEPEAPQQATLVPHRCQTASEAVWLQQAPSPPVPNFTSSEACHAAAAVDSTDPRRSAPAACHASGAQSAATQRRNGKGRPAQPPCFPFGLRLRGTGDGAGQADDESSAEGSRVPPTTSECLELRPQLAPLARLAAAVRRSFRKLAPPASPEEETKEAATAPPAWAAFRGDEPPVESVASAGPLPASQDACVLAADEAGTAPLQRPNDGAAGAATESAAAAAGMEVLVLGSPLRRPEHVSAPCSRISLLCAPLGGDGSQLPALTSDPGRLGWYGNEAAEDPDYRFVELACNYDGALGFAKPRLAAAGEAARSPARTEPTGPLCSCALSEPGCVAAAAPVSGRAST
ncbi:hypothetical protein GPECTOR_9g587 [Gonium pectorale]|uniref:Uncharacterized protein n=1 Tax=Gonium pectorale TaxID=33097 RepID=A0A150GRX1_GONPE|nr:hypothetical protein GPECTOR_9g587 [Gonium pectorale]|eukprot:KXZ52543.1 hypothetical protein GPECTOR_9g587 [Gonium pectorale]